MKRPLCLLAALLLAALCACGGAPSPAESPAPAPAAGRPAATTLTFTDDLGREVTAPAPPQRVAALLGSYADVWCLAGGQDTLAAAAHDAWTDFALDLGGDVADLGGLLEPSLEALIAAEPDFVLASSNTAAHLELQSALEELGIPVAYFDVNSFADYLAMLQTCTMLTGRDDLYQQNGLDVQAQVDDAKARADGSAPTVLVLRAAGSSCKVKNSQGTVLGEMLADLGAVNIADSDTQLLEDLSLERILADDPDCIFVVYQGDDEAAARRTLEAALTANPAWNTLTAVQQGRFYVMDKQLFHLKPNARWGEAYQQAAALLYGG